MNNFQASFISWCLKHRLANFPQVIVTGPQLYTNTGSANGLCANVDPVLCRHMASFCHNFLFYPVYWIIFDGHNNLLFLLHYLSLYHCPIENATAQSHGSYLLQQCLKCFKNIFVIIDQHTKKHDAEAQCYKSYKGGGYLKKTKWHFISLTTRCWCHIYIHIIWCETFSALLAICAGNSAVPSEFPTQRPVTRSFNVFFELRLNKRLNKQSWGCWCETRSPIMTSL